MQSDNKTEVKKQVLQLLPKGQFLINITNADPIKGRFSMYVLDTFCQSKGIENYILLLEKIVVGMSIGDYADLIVLAIDDYYRNQDNKSGYDRVKVMDLIDTEFDGISSDYFDELVKHAIGRVANVKKLEKAISNLTEAQEEEKKRESNNNLTGSSSESIATSQG